MRSGRARVRGSTGRRAAALAAGWIATLAAGPVPRALAAQDAPREAPASPFVFLQADRPVLGVYLVERCETVRPVERPCSAPPLIQAVETGGPADRAGVHPGDTLLAVDGEPLTTPAGRGALASLEEGRPVRVTLGRADGGPRVVAVTPEVIGVGRVKRRLRTFGLAPEAAPFPPLPGELAEFAVVEVPEIAVRFPVPDPVAFRLDSLHAALAGRGRGPDGAVVYFVGDSAGAVRIGAWTADSFRMLVDPGEELAAGRRPGTGRAAAGAARPTEARVAVRERTPAPGAYVWDNPELAHRLEVIHDSVGRAMRVRLDALQHLRPTWDRHPLLAPDSIHVHVERLLREEAGAAGQAGRRAPHPLPRVSASEVQALFVGDARAAGAEFTTLTPGLAENLQGVTRGLLVLRVLPETPAARIGLRDGDVLVEADGVACATVEDLRAVLRRGIREERPVLVKWIRKGTTMTGRLSGS